VVVCVGSSVPASAPAGGEATSTRAPGISFRQLYDQHFDLVFRLITRFGVDPAEVEDLTQRVFVVAYRRMDRVGTLDQPQAWLRAIAVRILHEHHRWRRVRRLRAWLVENSWAGRRLEESTPERSLLDQETLTRIRWVLGQMSAKLCDTLVLVELEELSPHEAAAILGIPLNTVRSRRLLARVEFRRLWHQRKAEHD
jgi:RNA polymerase sigma-70 factor (ECF subfamily)